MKGNIIVYTGNGGGKTTAALGLALRAVGHNKKVVIIQFLKGRKDIGEYKVRDRLGSHYEIHQFGTTEFINLKHPTEKDKERALKALKFAEKKIHEDVDMLILDEINLAAAAGLINVGEVVEMLKSIPHKTITVLTGRHAPVEFIEAADYAVEIKDLKRPEKEYPPRKGFEY